MKVSVFGNDVAALVCAGALAKTGNHVKVVFYDDENDGFSNNKLGIEAEPGLTDLLLKQQSAQRLAYVADDLDAILNSEVIIINLPSNELLLAKKLIIKIAKTINSNVLIVNQSTFPVGTTEAFNLLVEQEFKQRAKIFSCEVIAMPELISKGSALKQFLNPDRIILGGGSADSLTLMQALLKPFYFDENQIKLMSSRAAEYTKFALNSMLATRVSLINELANSAELLGIDVEELRQGIGSDSRIGFHYINPGCGFGGSSFSADIKTLIDTFDEKGADSTLLSSALVANENQKEVLFRKAWRYFSGKLVGKKFAVWGLSYKPNTSSVENSPSLDLVTALLAQGAEVSVFDPKAAKNFIAKIKHENLLVADDMYTALKDADALFVLTEWQQFYNPDFMAMKPSMKQAVIFDGRNLYSPKLLADKGFFYSAIGRGEVV